jgi:hypothetical protein
MSLAVHLVTVFEDARAKHTQNRIRISLWLAHLLASRVYVFVLLGITIFRRPYGFGRLRVTMSPGFAWNPTNGSIAHLGSPAERSCCWFARFAVTLTGGLAESPGCADQQLPAAIK